MEIWTLIKALYKRGIYKWPNLFITWKGKLNTMRNQAKFKNDKG